MEKMMEGLLKSFGFDPEKTKTAIATATIEFKAMQDQLNRIEVALTGGIDGVPVVVETKQITDTAGNA